MQNIIRLQRTEYWWVKNILNVAKKDIQFKNGIKTGNLNAYTRHILTWNPKINKDGHSGDSMYWCLNIANHILKNGSQVKKHKSGLSYVDDLAKYLKE